jgi:predicted NUDIX family phosphoesterase
MRFSFWLIPLILLASTCFCYPSALIPQPSFFLIILIAFPDIPPYIYIRKLERSRTRMAEELVLTFPRQLFEEIGTFQGMHTNIGSYIPRILEAHNTRFIPRSKAEEDPAFKQIIPYVLFKKGEMLLHYVRGKGSGEKRLVAKGSLGIGGHINHRDENLFGTGLDFYAEAVQRELHEELRIDGHFRTKIIGLINDDSTPVGQVHFGVVHLCELGAENVWKGEACITDLRFMTLEELKARREQMETWSQLCLDYIETVWPIIPGIGE